MKGRTAVVYEISNPSDPYTIEVTDFPAAAAAVAMLGYGQYGLHPINDPDAPELPILAFADDPLESFKAIVGRDLQEVMEDSRTAMAEALDTVVIGGKQARATYERALALIPDEAGRQEWREKWHDDHRSSMNDIGARAQALAQQLRKATGEDR